MVILGKLVETMANFYKDAEWSILREMQISEPLWSA